MGTRAFMGTRTFMGTHDISCIMGHHGLNPVQARPTQQLGIVCFFGIGLLCFDLLCVVLCDFLGSLIGSCTEFLCMFQGSHDLESRAIKPVAMRLA